MAKSEEPITIKKYANRRLYNTGTSTYVTLEDLAADGQGRRGLRRLRRQDRRGHHPLGAGADHLRAGEQGRAEPPADRFPAPADPLLRRQHADAGAALSGSVDRPRSRASRKSSASRWRRRSARVRRSARSRTRCAGTWRCSSAPSRCSRRSPSARRRGRRRRGRRAGGTGAGRNRRDRRAQAPDRRDAEAPRPDGQQGQAASAPVASSV